MVVWNDTNNARLLKIILTTQVQKIDYAQCAELFGQNATPKAISEHIAKLKKQGGTIPTTSTTSPTPATPRKQRKNQKVLEGGITKKNAEKVKKEVIVKAEVEEFQ